MKKKPEKKISAIPFVEKMSQVAKEQGTDPLKILNQFFWGQDKGSFYSSKHPLPTATHLGTDEVESLAFLRGYFPCGFSYDENGEIVAASWKNKDFLRLRDVIMHLVAPLPGKVVLDIGCNKGATMIYAGLQGAEVYGQDYVEEEITIANKCLDRFQLKGEAKVGDVKDLKFPDNFFDIAIASDFYEHIVDEEKIKSFKEVLRVLKPGGVLLIKTPNLQYLKISLFYKRIIAVSRFQNPLALSIASTNIPDACEGHTGLTKRKELSRCLINAGFQNYQFFYAPLRRFGFNYMLEILSTEIPVLRDLLCEDLIVRAYKPIALSYFPD